MNEFHLYNIGPRVHNILTNRLTMKGKPALLFLLSSVVILLCLSCSQQPKTGTATPANEYLREIALAQEKVRENPEDLEAVRELGILYFKSGQFEKAIPMLEKADTTRTVEPRVSCYLGLSYEMAGQIDLAMATFLKYVQLPPQSPYRKWMKGRHNLLYRRKIKDEITALLLQETRPDSTGNFGNAVLVLPFDYHGKDQKYFFLGKGLQALIIKDIELLGKTRVVDRLRIQLFLDELSKREELLKNVENRTAWIGQKFKTGMVVKGAYNIIDDSQLIMDYAYWDLTKSEIPNNITRPDELLNIFKIEKDIVLGLIRKMDIELKPALRDSVMKTSLTDLPAFIAYSAGLAKEDGGEYKEAIVFYRKALELAPGFRDCAERIEANEALSLAQRDPDKAITDRDFAEAN